MPPPEVSTAWFDKHYHFTEEDGVIYHAHPAGVNHGDDHGGVGVRRSSGAPDWQVDGDLLRKLNQWQADDQVDLWASVFDHPAYARHRRSTCTVVTTNGRVYRLDREVSRWWAVSLVGTTAPDPLVACLVGLSTDWPPTARELAVRLLAALDEHAPAVFDPAVTIAARALADEVGYRPAQVQA